MHRFKFQALLLSLSLALIFSVQSSYASENCLSADLDNSLTEATPLLGDVDVYSSLCSYSYAQQDYDYFSVDVAPGEELALKVESDSELNNVPLPITMAILNAPDQVYFNGQWDENTVTYASTGDAHFKLAYLRNNTNETRTVYVRLSESYQASGNYHDMDYHFVAHLDQVCDPSTQIESFEDGDHITQSGETIQAHFCTSGNDVDEYIITNYEGDEFFFDFDFPEGKKVLYTLYYYGYESPYTGDAPLSAQNAAREQVLRTASNLELTEPGVLDVMAALELESVSDYSNIVLVVQGCSDFDYQVGVNVGLVRPMEADLWIGNSSFDPETGRLEWDLGVENGPLLIDDGYEIRVQNYLGAYDENGNYVRSLLGTRTLNSSTRFHSLVSGQTLRTSTCLTTGSLCNHSRNSHFQDAFSALVESGNMYDLISQVMIVAPNGTLVTELYDVDTSYRSNFSKTSFSLD